ncbi:hypothetical protein ACFYZE_28515 [Streptomyces sp. NPDC001796]|uniref:hypothetical protein n=1 Tax=Streptomyces sp. NPDC001796 TaxID=3364609 RepID=UPI003698A73C
MTDQTVRQVTGRQQTLVLHHLLGLQYMRRRHRCERCVQWRLGRSRTGALYHARQRSDSHERGPAQQSASAHHSGHRVPLP